jgi:hypothetical protein
LQFQIANGGKEEIARTEKTAAVSRDPRTAAAATVIVRGARFFSKLDLIDFSALSSPLSTRN